MPQEHSTSSCLPNSQYCYRLRPTKGADHHSQEKICNEIHRHGNQFQNIHSLILNLHDIQIRQFPTSFYVLHSLAEPDILQKHCNIFICLNNNIINEIPFPIFLLKLNSPHSSPNAACFILTSSKYVLIAREFT